MFTGGTIWILTHSHISEPSLESLSVRKSQAIVGPPSVPSADAWQERDACAHAVVLLGLFVFGVPLLGWFKGKLKGPPPPPSPFGGNLRKDPPFSLGGCGHQ